ncbi:MAG TPA: CDP-glucose 4,6-dehydratase [Acetobacteraceae bacterium]|nr:CDP-glucose 4,6-dehydratase [Acetobacteraceae bacterium]
MTTPLPNPRLWAGKRVLVAGHTGFKGGWLALWLQALGADVHGLALPAEPGSLGAALAIDRLIPSTQTDIRDPAAVQAAVQAAAPDIVFHLAGQALVRRAFREPAATFATNALGTAHLLEAARETPTVRAVVIATSDKCYASGAGPHRETDRLGGDDPYSASKAAAELVAAAWRRSFPIRAAIATARAGNVIGGGDWAEDRLIPDCVRAFAAGLPVRLRNPEATRPFQHVLDPLCGYLLVAERLQEDGAAAQAWNFGPDGAPTVAELVRLFANHWGDGAAWTADDAPHPPESATLALDASLARDRLRWRPRLDLDTALRRTATWYKQHLAGACARTLIRDEIAAYPC